MSDARFEFRLADVGEGLHEAEVRRWLVAAGDVVMLDQPLVEVETDKAVVELPSPVAGRVTRLGAAEGAVLNVGDIVAVLEPDGGPRAASAGQSGSVDDEGRSADGSPASAQLSAAAAQSSVTRRALATPAVRKLARDLGVDLAAVTGSGPDGRILATDVEAFGRDNHGHLNSSAADRSAFSRAPAVPSLTLTDDARGTPPPAFVSGAELGPSGQAPAETRLPLRGLRRRIAQTMTRAWTTIPHITGFDEVEVSALVSTRERLKPVAERRGLRLTFLPFIVKAVTVALREHPIVNASLDEAAEEIVLHGAANVGIATATPDGLIVPVLHDAGGKTLLEIQVALDSLAERARARTSTPEELRGGTFTITNFGALGGWQAAPIIRPGEAAILGVGRIQERPWVVAGHIEPRPVLPLSLAADHRLIDGDVSTAFLTRIGELLSSPELLLLEML